MQQEQRLQNLRDQGDSHGLMIALRSVLVRNYGDIDSYKLQGSYMTVRKEKIESYVNEIMAALDSIMADTSVSHGEKAKFLTATRQTLGFTACLLSGGGSLAMYHMGVIKVSTSKGLITLVPHHIH